MTPLEQTTVNYARVGLSNDNKVHIEVNSTTTADGYSVTETGIVLYNSSGVPALELLLENVGGDIKNGKKSNTHYSANIADNGSGVFVHGYVKISDGTNEYVKYTYNLYTTLDDVTHAPASGISNPITIMPLVYKKAMHFTGLTSAFYRPDLYPIYAENAATVENSKTIPIYSNSHNLFEESQIVNDTPGNTFKTFRIQLTPNTSYTMSSNVPLYNQGALIVFAPDGASSVTTGTNGVWEGQSRTFTSPENGKMIVGYRGNSSGYDLTSYWYMINEGSTALPYEPYYKPLVSYSFEGQCNQASTPTPSNPVEVEEFGDKTVNLYNDSTTTDGYRIYWSNGEPYADANSATSDYISVIPETTYSLSAATYIAGYDSNKTFLGTWSSSGWTKSGGGLYNSITTTSDCYYLKIVTYNKATIHNNFMLNKGSTALPYEPYGKYKIPITSAGQIQNIILSEPLCKIGDYTDSVDSNGVVTRRIKKLVLDGTEDWTDAGISGLSRMSIVLSDAALVRDSICSHYIYDPDNLNVNNHCFITSTLSTFMFCDNTNANSLSNWTTFLATQYANGTPVTVYYVLATPKIEYLPPYNNLFDYKTAYSTYINANGEIEGNAYSISNVTNYFTADQIGKSITITAFAKTVLSSRVAIKTRINGVNKESNSITQNNSGLLKITVTPTSTSDYFCLTYGSGSYNNIYSWVGFNEGTNYIPAPTIPTSSGFSNIEISTSLAPSKFTYDLGKMFVAKGQGKVRVNGEWV